MRAISGKFTGSENDFIWANYSSMSCRNIALHLNRSEKSISDFFGRNGLNRFRSSAFTPEEDKIIRAGFGGSSVTIARQLNRAPSVVRSRARRIGLGKWKRGYKDFRGYKVVKLDGARRVPEHREIVEKSIGRNLTSSEIIHHINFRKRDNWPDNLHICDSVASHHKAHYSLYGLVASLLERGIIIFDGIEGVYKLCETNK